MGGVKVGMHKNLTRGMCSRVKPVPPPAHLLFFVWIDAHTHTHHTHPFVSPRLPTLNFGNVHSSYCLKSYPCTPRTPPYPPYPRTPRTPVPKNCLRHPKKVNLSELQPLNCFVRYKSVCVQLTLHWGGGDSAPLPSRPPGTKIMVILAIQFTFWATSWPHYPPCWPGLPAVSHALFRCLKAVFNAM